MNPSDMSVAATLARQMLQNAAGTVVGVAVARSWLSGDLAGHAAELLVGLAIALGTAAWADWVERRTHAAVKAVQP